MRHPLAITLAFFSLLTATRAAPDQKETMAIINSVNKRVMAGDAKALDDLKPLSRNDAIGSLLLFFKQNYYVMNATPLQKAIAARAVKLVMENPSAPSYFQELWRKPPGQRSGFLIVQRDTAIDCLSESNSKPAVRILCEALSEPDLGEQAKHVMRALVKMDLPAPPFPKTLPPAKLPEGSTSAEGLVKWKSWWAAHQNEFPEPPKVPLN